MKLEKNIGDDLGNIAAISYPNELAWFNSCVDINHIDKNICEYHSTFNHDISDYGVNCEFLVDNCAIVNEECAIIKRNEKKLLDHSDTNIHYLSNITFIEIWSKDAKNLHGFIIYNEEEADFIYNNIKNKADLGIDDILNETVKMYNFIDGYKHSNDYFKITPEDCENIIGERYINEKTLIKKNTI